MQEYIPQNSFRQRPYKERMRNRCIAIVVFIGIIAGIAHCTFAGDEEDAANTTSETSSQKFVQNLSENIQGLDTLSGTLQDEDIENTRASVTAVVAPGNPPKSESTDNLHIQSQKNVFLAEKIDLMLRRYKPDAALFMVVDAKSNEIAAWGERRDGAIQSKPDFLTRNTFPAASIAKIVTLAAAFESKRYSLNTPIPMIGSHHKLYKRQLRVPEHYTGPTMELQDVFAKSANPPMAIVGMQLGANRLLTASKNLGYNLNFPGNIPNVSKYAPPDTGYGLAEVSCGFTTATTLTPLLAAAQIRAIITKKKLEIPWTKGLAPYAPSQPRTLDVGTFNDNTYYGLREAMIRSVTAGTAHKQMSHKNMARKNFAALTIGGKTGSLDGRDPKGRYDWFVGFAQSKRSPSEAIIVIVMQIHQEIKSQPATQVAATIINYWANQNHLGD